MAGAGGGVLGAGGGLVVVLGAGMLCVATGAGVLATGAGVPLPPLVGVGEGDVAAFVGDGALPAETLCEGAQAPPASNRARPAISTAIPRFRLPIQSALLALFAVAIPPMTNPATPISIRNSPTLTPTG